MPKNTLNRETLKVYAETVDNAQVVNQADAKAVLDLAQAPGLAAAINVHAAPSIVRVLNTNNEHKLIKAGGVDPAEAADLKAAYFADDIKDANQTEARRVALCPSRDKLLTRYFTDLDLATSPLTAAQLFALATAGSAADMGAQMHALGGNSVYGTQVARDAFVEPANQPDAAGHGWQAVRAAALSKAQIKITQNLKNQLEGLADDKLAGLTAILQAGPPAALAIDRGRLRDALNHADVKGVGPDIAAETLTDAQLTTLLNAAQARAKTNFVQRKVLAAQAIANELPNNDQEHKASVAAIAVLNAANPRAELWIQEAPLKLQVAAAGAPPALTQAALNATTTYTNQEIKKDALKVVGAMLAKKIDSVDIAANAPEITAITNALALGGQAGLTALRAVPGLVNYGLAGLTLDQYNDPGFQSTVRAPLERQNTAIDVAALGPRFDAVVGAAPFNVGNTAPILAGHKADILKKLGPSLRGLPDDAAKEAELKRLMEPLTTVRGATAATRIFQQIGVTPVAGQAKAIAEANKTTQDAKIAVDVKAEENRFFVPPEDKRQELKVRSWDWEKSYVVRGVRKAGDVLNPKQKLKSLHDWKLANNLPRVDTVLGDISAKIKLAEASSAGAKLINENTSEVLAGLKKELLTSKTRYEGDAKDSFVFGETRGKKQEYEERVREFDARLQQIEALEQKLLNISSAPSQELKFYEKAIVLNRKEAGEIKAKLNELDVLGGLHTQGLRAIKGDDAKQLVDEKTGEYTGDKAVLLRMTGGETDASKFSCAVIEKKGGITQTTTYFADANNDILDRNPFLAQPHVKDIALNAVALIYAHIKESGETGVDIDQGIPPKGLTNEQIKQMILYCEYAGYGCGPAALIKTIAITNGEREAFKKLMQDHAKVDNNLPPAERVKQAELTARYLSKAEREAIIKDTAGTLKPSR